MSEQHSGSGAAVPPPPRGYVDPAFPNPGGAWDTPIIIYGYTPSLALAAFAAAWFAALLAWHAALVVRLRCWWFAAFAVGLVFEVVGYVARSLSARRDPYHLIYFILNYFFIVTAPVFLAAGIYTVLSALMARLGGSGDRLSSSLRPGLVLGFFVTSDIIATIAQVTGAALIGVSESRRRDPTTANNILLGGLAYQVLAMGVFVTLASVFLVRARRRIAASGLGAFCAVFAAATLLVYLRTAFRLAETAQGLLGELQTREVWFACLEFAPVALAVLLLAIWHPGRCVGSSLRATDADAGKERVAGR